MAKKFIGKNNLYTIVVIAVVVVVLAGINMFLNPEALSDNSGTTSNPQKTNSPKSAVIQTGTTPSLTYDVALKTYAGRRIQFDINATNSCVLTPNNISLKAGDTIMLDNREAKQLAISLDGVNYNLPAYGFKIISLNTSSPLPHTIKINCDNGKNNGSIILGL